MKNIQLTDAQSLILHAFLSMLASGLVGGFQAGYQYATQSGAVNIGQAISFSLASFLALFGRALYAYVPSHVTEELQAWKDTAIEAQQELASLAASQRSTRQAVQPQPPVQNSPLVVIHTTPPTVNQPVPFSLQGIQVQVEHPPEEAALPAHLAALTPSPTPTTGVNGVTNWDAAKSDTLTQVAVAQQKAMKGQ